MLADAQLLRQTQPTMTCSAHCKMPLRLLVTSRRRCFEFVEAILASILIAALLVAVLGMPIGLSALCSAVAQPHASKIRVSNTMCPCRSYIPCVESHSIFRTRIAWLAFHFSHFDTNQRSFGWLIPDITIISLTLTGGEIATL